MGHLPPIVIADHDGLRQACLVLQAGGAVALPTETVYGLAAHALDQAAVDAVARIKGRPDNQPFPVLVRDITMVNDLVDRIPDAALRLMEQQWPGPLTIVLPGRRGLPPSLTGPGGAVGLRNSSDPVVSALMELVRCPLTGTSANLSGTPAATTAQDARLHGVGLVLDSGPRDEPPSTVIALLDDGMKVLREGAVIVKLK